MMSREDRPEPVPTSSDPAQVGIFDGPEPRARRSDPRTSHEAAESMPGAASAQRLRIYQYLSVQGPKTADELDDELGLRPTSAGRRLPELLAIQKVYRMPETKKTRSGRQAHLWAAVL